MTQTMRAELLEKNVQTLLDPVSEACAANPASKEALPEKVLRHEEIVKSLMDARQLEKERSMQSNKRVTNLCQRIL